LKHFLLLAFFFGLVLYAGTSSVVVLATQAERSWLLWSALLPLAAAHWAAGFLATWKNLPKSLAVLSCAAISGATTVLAVGVAAWATRYIGLWMPTHTAVLILFGASLASLCGLALVIRLWLASRVGWPLRFRRRSLE